MGEPLLQINDLSKTYDKGKTFALSQVSFRVSKGEFVAIIGSSGAGKSTLIRCINRLITPSGGSILFDGLNITKIASYKLKKVRRQMGMIFQHYNLIGPATVKKNVLHGRLGHLSYLRSLFGLYPAEDKAEAEALLHTVGLSEHLHKKATMLSGGQMQRVGICRALMQHPKLLLADEPIASLDPATSHTVMQHLKDATTQRDLACICNLHQVEFAKAYATRIIAMKQGKIVFDGTPDKLTDSLISDIYKTHPPNEPPKNPNPSKPHHLIIKPISWLATLLLMAGAFFFLNVSPWTLGQVFPQLGQFLSHNFFPVNFTGISVNFPVIFHTLLFAVVATYLSSFLSFFMALLMSSEMNPLAPVRLFFRALMSFLRNIPMLIWATLLVFIFGIGPVVGIVALIFTTMGFLARSYAESIDAISSAKLEGIRSTGASYVQVLTHGLIPEFTPAWLNWTLFTLEVNMRASAILGMVGAGGLGLLIQTTLDWRNFRRAMALILILVAMVLFTELLCNWLRGQLEKARTRHLSPLKSGIIKGGVTFGLMGGYVFAVQILSLDLERFISRFENVQRILPLFFSWNGAAIPDILYGLLISVAIALAGLSLAFTISLPLAFLAAKNTAPFWPLAYVIKGFVAVVRAIPSLVLILMIVASLGFGYTAGVMGLFFSGFAYLTKAFIATIEEQDPAIIETMTSMGASWLQLVSFGMLPHVFRSFISWVSIRFESNVGDAVSLGIVGAGGIGMIVNRAIRQHDFATLSTALVFIFATLFLIELATGALKNKLRA